MGKIPASTNIHRVLDRLLEERRQACERVDGAHARAEESLDAAARWEGGRE